MTRLLDIKFDDGPDEADITTTTTPEITTQSGTKPKFDATVPSLYADSSFSARTNLASGTSFNVCGFTSQTTVYFQFYFLIDSTSSANSVYMNWRKAGVRIGELRLDAGAQTMTIRDNATARATSGTIALGTWHRAVVKCIPNTSTGHRLKLFLGSNIEGSTPDYDSGDVSATLAGQTSCDEIVFGFLAGSDMHIHIAGVHVETTDPTTGGGGTPSKLPLGIDLAGANGTEITTVNTPAITSQSGTFPLFSTEIPPDYDEGSGGNLPVLRSALVDMAAVTSFNSIDIGTEAESWMGFYFRYHQLPPANVIILSWLKTSTKIGDLRLKTDGHLDIRDSSTAVATTTNALAINTWHRIAVHADPGSASGHRLKTYEGANRHGTAPNYDSTGVAATAAGQSDMNTWRFGILATGEAHYRMARFRMSVPEPTGIGVSISDMQYASAGTWKNIQVQSAIGGVWV